MSTTAQQLPPTMTVAEFLSWDDGTDARYELVDGYVTAMAPPSPQHSRIAANIAGALYGRLQPPCGAYAEYGIPIKDDDRTCFQADLAVVCADIRRDAPPPEPTVIIEIVSPTSDAHDLGRKRPAYMQLATCQLMLFVHTNRRHVERWTRAGDNWLVQSHIGPTGQIPLEPLATTLDLETIYEAVDTP